MENTLEDFKKHAKVCVDEYEADRVCFQWLMLSCMEQGTSSDYIKELLTTIDKMMNSDTQAHNVL